MNALFDPRRPWPLLTVVVLHGAFFPALQAGLLHRVVSNVAMHEVIAAQSGGLGKIRFIAEPMR